MSIIRLAKPVLILTLALGATQTAVARHSDISQKLQVELNQKGVIKTNVAKRYKAQKWNAFVKRHKSLSARGQKAAVPETDCPPLPTQDCIDSWGPKKLKPIWPF